MGSKSHPNPYVGHAASQLGVALPTLAQTALKAKWVAVVRVGEQQVSLADKRERTDYNNPRTGNPYSPAKQNSMEEDRGIL